MLSTLLPIALVGCVATEISEVTPTLEASPVVVDTAFTGASACLNGPLVTPVFCTVFDASAYLFPCEPEIEGQPCWYAVDDDECASGFQIVVVRELPVATSTTYEAACWSR